MGKKAVSKLFYCTSIALTFVLAGITIAGAFAGHIPPEHSTLMPFIGLALSGLFIDQSCRRHLLGDSPEVLDHHSVDSHSCQLAISGSDLPTSFHCRRKRGKYTENSDIQRYSFGNEQSGYSCKEIAAYMKQHRVDIICFQEFVGNRYFTSDSIRNAFADWQYAVIPQTLDSTPILQVALFSKYPVKDSRLITYPDSRNCSMWCDLNVDGQTVRIFNNHLQTTEVSQNKRRLEGNWLKTN